MTPTTRPPLRGPLCYYSLQVLYLLYLLWEFHELYASPANSGVLPAPFTNNIRSPTLWFDLHPFWYHVTSICLSHISDEGVGAGSGPRSAMKTIVNCFSNWKTHFHDSKFFTGIRTRGLIIFGLVHFLCASEATIFEFNN
jgi:hypothetical protein